MPESLDERLRKAFQEDLPNGDLTTDTIFSQPRFGRARLVAKEDLVLSHRQVFESAVRFIAPETMFKWEFQDGDMVLERQTLCMLQGDLVKILKAERVALNFLGHLCGIATLTRCFVNQVKETKCRILDTRKTMPLYRDLEKEAVRNGGGTNHRMNLSDAVLIKENHIRAAGGLRNAVAKVKHKLTVPIEVECLSIEDIRDAVASKVQRILLDNMSNDVIQTALTLIPATIETEASGNMALDRVRSVAELGVDFISVGRLTHSAPCADLSLLFEWDNNDWQ
jgi:nicotinate-nucleotide pyrophosphorylase (carboxylating)